MMMGLVHCLDGLASPGLLLSVLLEAALRCHCSFGAILLAIVITNASLDEPAVRLAGIGGDVVDEDIAEAIVAVGCLWLLSQRGSVENLFDLRLILGHVKSICSSSENFGGLRVLCEGVHVVDVVAGVVESLDLGHFY